MQQALHCTLALLEVLTLAGVEIFSRTYGISGLALFLSFVAHKGALPQRILHHWPIAGVSTLHKVSLMIDRVCITQCFSIEPLAMLLAVWLTL